MKNMKSSHLFFTFLFCLYPQELLASPPIPPSRLDTGAPFKTLAKAPQVSEGVVTQVGEIVVMEGDAEIVTELEPGVWGVEGGQMEAIAQRFYLKYPDEFDGIAVFTTFQDAAQSGAAYAIGLSTGVSGINSFGGSGSSFGSSSGKLISVTNMNDTDSYSTMGKGDAWFYSTFGQEFGHSWLSYIKFVDPETGQESEELLGRDGSHWSAIFNSGASVMDGIEIADNGDGSFTVGKNSIRYGPLDLYAMGIISPDEVEDLFIVRNATYADGGRVGLTDHLNGGVGEGTRIYGDRLDIRIADIVAAHGPRIPAWDEVNEDFRIAFILVTKTGETAADVQERIDKLEVGRYTWEYYHLLWTDKRSTMCTDVTATCPLAKLEVDDVEVNEDPESADMDGIIEPGEKVLFQVTMTNTGTEAAVAGTVEFQSEDSGLALPDVVELPEIAVGEQYVLKTHGTIGGSACGLDIAVWAQSRLKHRTWRGGTEFRPGLKESASPEEFKTKAGWESNDEEDAVEMGAWEHGVPQSTKYLWYPLQPSHGAGGVGDPAWFTGPFGFWSTGELKGTTQLTSAPFDLRGMYAPILRLALWYVALDRDEEGEVVHSEKAHLKIQASDDDGSSWTTVDEVSGEPRNWSNYEVPLKGKISATKEVRFRFIASDDLGPEMRLVEVGIDDVVVISLAEACDEGCGCRGSGENPGVLALLFFLAVLIGFRRRRTN